jgi:hypothetical protein
MVKLSLFATATDSRVDAENGILRGVRVITKGEAKTHSFLGQPIICDDQTIAEVVEAAATFPDGVPVKLAHGTDIEELVGSIRNITNDGDCARGDLYLLKSHESFATIIEMAETMPSNFGISISFMNALEPVMSTDLDEDGDNDGIVAGYQDNIVAYAARVSELYAADLVANPSCNPALFSMSDNATTPEVPAEAPVEEVKVEEIAPTAEAPASEAKEELNSVTESAPAPEAPTEIVIQQIVADEIQEEAPVSEAIPAPEELSRKFDGFKNDFEATKIELSRVTSELFAARSELETAKTELSKRDSELVDLRYLHRSVLSVMGLAPSIEIPEINEEAPATTILEKYESMPAGPERLSYFQANRREIERSIAARLK